MIRLHAHGDHGYPLCSDPTPDSSGLVVTTKNEREVDCPECAAMTGLGFIQGHVHSEPACPWPDCTTSL